MLGMKIIYHGAPLLNLIGNSITTGLTLNRCHKKQDQKKKKKKKRKNKKKNFKSRSSCYICPTSD